MAEPKFQQTKELPLTYPIQPGDINAKQMFWGAFDRIEREISAGWIVRLCQERGSWAAFTREDIEEFYGRNLSDGFLFNGLDLDGNIVNDRDKYIVTERFVTACYKGSPNKKKRE